MSLPEPAEVQLGVQLIDAVGIYLAVHESKLPKYDKRTIHPRPRKVIGGCFKGSPGGGSLRNPVHC